MSSQKGQAKEQELKELAYTTFENNQNQFAPYVNMQLISQQQSNNQNYYNNNYVEIKEDLDQKKENNFENFKQYISNIQSNFSEESIGCQFFTVCNGIICFLILCVIIKSL